MIKIISLIAFIAFLTLKVNTLSSSQTLSNVQMPPELLNHLFSYLTTQELFNLSQTTKRAQNKLNHILKHQDIETSYKSIFGLDAWKRLENHTKDDRFFSLVNGEVYEINKFGLTEKEIKDQELKFCSGSSFHLEIINDYIRNHLENVKNPIKNTLWSLFKNAMTPIIQIEKETKKITSFEEIISRALKPLATLVYNKHLAQLGNQEPEQEIVPWTEVSDEDKADIFLLYYIHWRRFEEKYRDGLYNFPFFAGIRYILRDSNLIDIREIVLRKFTNSASHYFENEISFNQFFKKSKRFAADDIHDIFYMLLNFGC